MEGGSLEIISFCKRPFVTALLTLPAMTSLNFQTNTPAPLAVATIKYSSFIADLPYVSYIPLTWTPTITYFTHTGLAGNEIVCTGADSGNVLLPPGASLINL